MPILDAFGIEWELVRPGPNDPAVGALVNSASTGLSLTQITDCLCAHVYLAEQFHSELMEMDGLDIDWLFSTFEIVSAALYDGLPVRALMTLWTLWPERRHVHHGRLLAAGRQKGASDLDLHDVACLVWAELDGIVRSSEFTAPDVKRSDELATSLWGMQERSGDALAEVEGLRALLRQNAGQDAEDDDEHPGLPD